MPSFAERAPRERETLIYDTPEAAREFSEAAHEKLRQQPPGSIKREREAVGEHIAQEFAAAGHAVSTLKNPWEHTPAEHAEAQELADLAFAKNLSAAIAAARKRDSFPRNLDLLHDILTGELYESLREHQANQQPIISWVMLSASLILLALILGTLLLIFS